jgi:dipeptidyl aminopeptidase/acylaminoacyl peptidase
MANLEGQVHRHDAGSQLDIPHSQFSPYLPNSTFPILNSLLMVLLVSLAVAAQPQQPPGTDIFIAPLTARGTDLTLGTPVNVTRFAGYDNQPFFTADGKTMLFTSRREGEQTDIYEYDLAARTARRVTSTTESEYSPTITPDGRGISVIRVEADGTQRLWRFTREGADPQLVLRDVKPVGYHAWMDASTLALFVLGEPATLQVADIAPGKRAVVASDIGRSLLKVPGRDEISFVQRREGTWHVMTLATATRTVAPLVAAHPESSDRDTAWTPDGVLLMSAGSKIFAWRRADGGAGAPWREIANLAAVRGITRMAVSPAGDRLAIVGEDSP